MSKRSAESETTTFPRVQDVSNKRPKQQRKPGKKPLYTASVMRAQSTNTTSAASEETIEKIRKCLERGKHPNTSENEAKAALHLASRWMARYNVSQAQIFAGEDASTHIKHAGQTDVRICRMDMNPSIPVRYQGHLGDLCIAVGRFFSCKSYSASDGLLGNLTISFYGIKLNTVAAADAFEMMFNLIAQWALSYKGNGPRESYCLGISTELRSIAKREEIAEEIRAAQAEDAALREREAQEAVAEQARLARLVSLDTASDGGSPQDSAVLPCGKDDKNQMGSGTAKCDDDRDSHDLGEEECSDEEDFFEPTFKIEENDDVNLDISDDLDETICKLLKQEPQSPGEEEPSKSELPWPEPDQSGYVTESPGQVAATGSFASRSALALFMKTNEAIADDYIKSKDKKLSARAYKAPVIRDRDAYEQGKCDSHKIDFRGRTKRIEDAAI